MGPGPLPVFMSSFASYVTATGSLTRALGLSYGTRLLCQSAESSPSPCMIRSFISCS